MFQKIVFFPKPKVESMVIEFVPITRKEIKFKYMETLKCYQCFFFQIKEND